MVKDVEFIYLLNEEGKEEKMRVITFLDIKDIGGEYVVVTPAEVETEEAYVLKFVKDENGNENYIIVEDDAEFDMVSEAYMLVMQDEFEVE